MAEQLYDTIGEGYASARQADAEFERQIHDCLGPGRRVLNVGAGTGNYEPLDRDVVALEPSMAMLAQRTNGVPAVQGVAERLPFADDSFDVAMGVLTVHHWPDRTAGLREARRVAKRQVFIVYDLSITAGFWFHEFWPTVATAGWEIDAPTPEELGRTLDVIDVRPWLVSSTCTDGVTGAYWNRPERYLDPNVQRSMSTFARLDPDERAEGNERLRVALDDGSWDERFGHLRADTHHDIGYRLVIAENR